MLLLLGVPLPQALPFTDAASLSANAQGHLTPAQKNALRVGPRFFVGGLLGGVFLLVCLLFLSALRGLVINPTIWSQQFFELLVSGALIVVGSIFGRRPLWAWFCTWQDALAGQVRTTQGNVAWRQKAYRAHFPQQPALIDEALSLLPGPYRFYYLPQSGQLVGAEALFAPAQAVAPVQTTLAAVWPFDAATLSANRAGHFSAAQQADLQKDLKLYGGGILMACLVGLGAIAYIYVTRSFPPPLVWAIVAAPFYVLFYAWQAWQSWRDLANHQVRCLTGLTTKSTTRDNGFTNYHLCLQRHRFSLLAHQYHAVLPGYYNLYYTPRTKTILSLEFLAPQPLAPSP